MDEKYVSIIDEWDYIFNNNLFTSSERKDYLKFLRNLLKGKGYVAFVYMTGILPIAKYSSGSDINMFNEYTMFSGKRYCEYFGFTKDEVKSLCEKYNSFGYDELASWYNGYKLVAKDGDGKDIELQIFNPRSVVHALCENELQSYWTNTGPMEEIVNYIKNNVEDVREDIVELVSGESIEVRLSRYSADNMELRTRKQILSAMVTYGFLTYHDSMLSIPNKELMMQFEEAVEDECMGYVSVLALKSERMLKATLEKKTSDMEAILEYTHDTEIPIVVYNDENSLACIVNLIYLSARNKYDMRREQASGKGFVDFIFYPKKKTDTVIIIELKQGRTAKAAIDQIYEKKYYMNVRKEGCTGNILVVGINYDKDSKEHDCIVEDLDKSRIDKSLWNVVFEEK